MKPYSVISHHGFEVGCIVKYKRGKRNYKLIGVSRTGNVYIKIIKYDGTLGLEYTVGWLSFVTGNMELVKKAEIKPEPLPYANRS